LTYQFPIYRWLSWLVVFGFAAGLGLMYLVAGMFGIPAPLGWAFLVILFCAGVALLERPKALLTVMMFYFLLMPSNRLFGLLGLPLPGFLDELFFVPFVAVIVMSWIQRSETPSGMWFPLAFIGVAGLSWYVNGRPSPFTTVQVTLIMLKFFIIWYFCRLTCTFKDLNQFWRWGEFYIHYAAAQYLYNCLWQRAPWVTTHPDYSGGVFGPDGAGGAHIVGYISVLALFLLAAWWIGESRKCSRWKRGWMLFLGMVITYDLVFMTDTKHVLLFMPVAFMPVLFHRRIPARLRISVLASGVIVVICGLVYMGAWEGRFAPWRYAVRMMDSPKGDAFMAVTVDFPQLVPYPILGAAPGRFLSGQAADAGAPLARRYLTPYRDEVLRGNLVHDRGSRTGGSMMAWPQSDGLTLMSEFGWLGTLVYVGFVCSIVFGLWKKASRAVHHPEYSAVCLVLSSGVLLIGITMIISTPGTAGCLMFPWWMLIGRAWDMRIGENAVPEGEVVPGDEGLSPDGGPLAA
jgi:hypothetical protein